MKITDKELRKIVREVVLKKVSNLKEGNDFTARREVVHTAENASMNFEREIIKLLSLIPPDDLSPRLQKEYYLIVDVMKKQLVDAIMDATRELAKFPKVDKGQRKAK